MTEFVAKVEAAILSSRGTSFAGENLHPADSIHPAAPCRKVVSHLPVL
ncbi:MAG: hypothetical protein IJN52_10990 [Bacteroidales bacterium]|nr:hypothetical protein [Bacteroidales bacterium]